MENVKGQFIPDLLLMQTIAFHPSELQEIFSVLDDANVNRRLPRQDYELDKLVISASWVHEFMHYLQFATRIHGIEYYMMANSIASKSIECSRQLFTTRDSKCLDFSFPLIGYAARAVCEKIECSIIHDWYDYWFTAQAVATVGGLSVRRSEDVFLHTIVKPNTKQPICPTITYTQLNKNDASETHELEISTENVLELEAILITTHYLQYYFPERTEEVLGELHGLLDKNTSLSLIIMSRGMDKLVPLLADFSMQASGWGAKGGYNEYACPWRFYNGLEACEKYAGISMGDIIRHRQEILSHLVYSLGTENISVGIETILSHMQSRIGAGLSHSFMKLAASTMAVRGAHDDWFVAPVVYLGELLSSIRLPRVQFNHHGIPDDSAMVLFGFGKNPLEPEDEGGIDHDRYRRWLGRELATRNGSMVCPACVIEERRGKCTGRCRYARIAEEEIGVPYHSITGRYS